MTEPSNVLPFRLTPTEGERAYLGVMYRVAIRAGVGEECLAELRLRLGFLPGSDEEAALLAEGLVGPSPSGEPK